MFFTSYSVGFRPTAQNAHKSPHFERKLKSGVVLHSVIESRTNQKFK